MTMTPEEKARIELVASLRGRAEVSKSGIGVLLSQAANEIEQLADKADYAEADHISQVLPKFFRDLIFSDVGEEVFLSPVTVANDKITFFVSAAYHTWTVSLRRVSEGMFSERGDNGPGSTTLEAEPTA
jgi:hypothetical protein